MLVLTELVDAKAIEEKKPGLTSNLAADVLAFLARRSSKHSGKASGGIHVQEDNEKLVPWARVENYIFPQENELAVDLQTNEEVSDVPRTIGPPSITAIIEADTPPSSSHGDHKEDGLMASITSLKSQAVEHPYIASATALTKDGLAALPGVPVGPDTTHIDYDKALMEKVTRYLDGISMIPSDMFPPFSVMTHEVLNCMTWRLQSKKLSPESNRLIIVTEDAETRYWANKVGIPEHDASVENGKRGQGHVRDTRRSGSTTSRTSNGHRRQSGSFDKLTSDFGEALPPTLITNGLDSLKNSTEVPVQEEASTVPEVIDPNSFSRSNGTKVVVEDVQPKSNRGNASMRRGRGGSGRLWVPGKT
jgi:hypothetical protein